MKHKLIIAIFTLSISFVLSNSFEIEAHADGKNTTIEYEDRSNILENIQTENGVSMSLSSVEQNGGIYQAVYCSSDAFQKPSEQSISPHIIVSSEKKVIKTYSTFDEIPSSISYEEYNNNYNIWMSGTLFLKKAERLGSGWTATYEGTLMGTL